MANPTPGGGGRRGGGRGRVAGTAAQARRWGGRRGGGRGGVGSAGRPAGRATRARGRGGRRGRRGGARRGHGFRGNNGDADDMMGPDVHGLVNSRGMQRGGTKRAVPWGLHQLMSSMSCEL
jgi:hypothetical protein